MKKFLFKIENLLLIAPLIFILVGKLWFANSVVDIHLHDTMFVIAVSHILWLLFLILFFYFSLHFLLRNKKWRNAAICNIHVIGTVISFLVLAIFLVLPSSVPLNPDIDSQKIKRIISKSNQLAYIISISWLIFTVFQVFFLFYFLITLIKRQLAIKRP
jgi:hypothetical protein